MLAGCSDWGGSDKNTQSRHGADDIQTKISFFLSLRKRTSFGVTMGLVGGGGGYNIVLLPWVGMCNWAWESRGNTSGQHFPGHPIHKTVRRIWPGRRSTLHPECCKCSPGAVCPPDSLRSSRPVATTTRRLRGWHGAAATGQKVVQALLKEDKLKRILTGVDKRTLCRTMRKWHAFLFR
jgi:hypothetical protein